MRKKENNKINVYSVIEGGRKKNIVENLFEPQDCQTKTSNFENKVLNTENKIVNNENKVLNNENKVLNNENKIVSNENRALSAENKVFNNENKVLNNETKIVNNENKVPNNYVFYSYKRFSPDNKLDFLEFNDEKPKYKEISKLIDQKQNFDKSENTSLEENKNTIENKNINNEENQKSLENSFSQVYNLPIREEKIIETIRQKNKIQARTEKNFFIGLMLFLNLALYALIAYNQISVLKANQSLIQQLNSSFETFEQEIQDSTNSILQELKKQQEQKKQYDVAPKELKSFLTTTKKVLSNIKSISGNKFSNKKVLSNKPSVAQTNLEEKNTILEKNNNNTYTEKQNTLSEKPKNEFTAIKLPPEDKGYKLNLSGQPEKYSAYEVQENFIQNPTVFYKSRK